MFILVPCCSDLDVKKVAWFLVTKRYNTAIAAARKSWILALALFNEVQCGCLELASCHAHTRGEAVERVEWSLWWKFSEFEKLPSMVVSGHTLFQLSLFFFLKSNYASSGRNHVDHQCCDQ